MDRILLTFAAATALACASAPKRAADDSALPPEQPTTAYEAKVRNHYEIAQDGGMESGADTVVIRVSGQRLRETSQALMEKTVVVDAAARSVLEFDERGDEPVAARFDLADAPIPYIHGRAALAAYDGSWPAPKVAGRDEVAGEPCTVLHYGAPGSDGIEACVSAQGVVMRAKIVWPGYQREFEVLEFDDGDQDEEHFAPPKGWKVVEGTD